MPLGLPRVEKLAQRACRELRRVTRGEISTSSVGGSGDGCGERGTRRVCCLGPPTVARVLGWPQHGAARVGQDRHRFDGPKTAREQARPGRRRPRRRWLRHPSWTNSGPGVGTTLVLRHAGDHGIVLRKAEVVAVHRPGDLVGPPEQACGEVASAVRVRTREVDPAGCAERSCIRGRHDKPPSCRMDDRESVRAHAAMING